jgi:hypothetical protein
MRKYRIYNHDTTLLKANYETTETLTILSQIEIDNVNYIVTNMVLNNSDDLNNPIIDVYVEKMKYRYMVTFSDDDYIVYSKKQYTTKEEAYLDMMKDALATIEEDMVNCYKDQFLCNTKIETNEYSIKLIFGSGVSYLYEIY